MITFLYTLIIYYEFSQHNILYIFMRNTSFSVYVNPNHLSPPIQFNHRFWFAFSKGKTI